MKTLTTLISAATLMVASSAASAWGWGDNGNNSGFGNGFGDGAFDGDFGFSMNFSGRGNGRGQGNGYNGYNGSNGYAPYGYAPYGYGVPVQPAVEMTDEQKKDIADQQAQYMDSLQKAQQQAADFWATQPRPQMQDMQKTMMEQHEAAIKEMDARMEESRKASDARRKASKEAFEARMKERHAKVEIKEGA